MELLKKIASSVLTHYTLFHWTDIVEILFFTGCFYYAALWLRKDRKNNLLFYFYAYCLATFLAYTLNLETVTHALLVYAPITAVIFITVHQLTLQKNFVVARSITRPQPQQDWLAVLFQSLLGAVSRNKQIICVIEKYDSLKTLLDSPLSFNAEVNKHLLDILLTSAEFDETKMILVNHHGNLLAINATWQALVEQEWTEEIQDFASWKQDALLLANKTDALVFRIEPGSRTVTLVAQKKFLEGISAHEAATVIKQYLYGNAAEAQSYRGTYEISKKHVEDQPLS